MIKAVIVDLSRVILFPRDEAYEGSLNALYNEESVKPDFYFFTYFELNDELLSLLESVKNKVRLLLFTSETIQNDPSVKSKLDAVFQGVYSAMDLEVHKNQIEAYQKVLAAEGLLPSEVLFIDDNPENVAAATEAGLLSIRYTSNVELVSDVASLVMRYS